MKEIARRLADYWLDKAKQNPTTQNVEELYKELKIEYKHLKDENEVLKLKYKNTMSSLRKLFMRERHIKHLVSELNKRLESE